MKDSVSRHLTKLPCQSTIFQYGNCYGNQVLVEHLAVEEEESAQGLILGRGVDLFIDGQMGEERFRFVGAHLGRMAPVVE